MGSGFEHLPACWAGAAAVKWPTSERDYPLVSPFHLCLQDLLGKGPPTGKKHQVRLLLGCRLRCSPFLGLHEVLFRLAKNHMTWLAYLALHCGCVSWQVLHDDKGNTTVSYMEAVDVSRPERVQALLDKAMKQVSQQRGRQGHWTLEIWRRQPLVIYS